MSSIRTRLASKNRYLQKPWTTKILSQAFQLTPRSKALFYFSRTRPIYSGTNKTLSLVSGALSCNNLSLQVQSLLPGQTPTHNSHGDFYNQKPRNTCSSSTSTPSLIPVLALHKTFTNFPPSHSNQNQMNTMLTWFKQIPLKHIISQEHISIA